MIQSFDHTERRESEPAYGWVGRWHAAHSADCAQCARPGWQLDGTTRRGPGSLAESGQVKLS